MSKPDREPDLALPETEERWAVNIWLCEGISVIRDGYEDFKPDIEEDGEYYFPQEFVELILEDKREGFYVPSQWKSIAASHVLSEIVYDANN